MTRDELLLYALNKTWNVELDGIVQTLTPEDFKLLEAMITEAEVANMASDYIDAEYEEI